MMLINSLGLGLIAFVVWWFWLYKPREVSVDKDGAGILITVENGVYTPPRLKVAAGQPVALTFERKDPSGCAATVVFSDFDISEELPLNKAKTISLPAMQPGEYLFTCQMQMYRGTLVVS